jgi:hypothetical protein
VSTDQPWAVPPGHRPLADIVQEHGRDIAQTKLASGEWPAFEFEVAAGDLKPIPATVWCATRGHKWLEKAEEGTRVWLRPAAWSQIALERFALVVRVSEQLPPDGPKAEDGPAVRLAKELMAAVFPQDEWREMKIRAVRKRCEQQAKARRVPLPSADSFSLAMGRRQRRK